MDDEKDLDKKLAEFDEKVTPQYLLKLHKLKLAQKIQSGETGLFEEFRKLKELEKQITPEAAPSASSSQPASSDHPEGAGTPTEEEEIGIPQRLLTKRHYTLTPAAIEARRKNAKCRKPGNEGNKNAWKTGLHAQDFITGRIKPCLSTCPLFEECELVSDGYTKPGDVCMDKAAVIETYSAIMEAIKGTSADKYDDFNSIAALMNAETIHVCRMLLEQIIKEGGVVKREKYDNKGVLHSIEYVPHPNLMALPKIIADLGLTPRELNITPKAIKDGKDSEEQGKTLAGIMSDLNRRARGDQEKKDEEETTIESEADT